MDYTEATRLMEQHAHSVRNGTGIVATHSPDHKKLKHRTTLRAVSVTSKSGAAPDEAPEYILKYFNTDIIAYRPKYVEINDGGFFSTSTHARFNEYLPRGFHISGTTYPQLHLKRPLGFVKTPAGTYPYRSRMAFKYSGEPFGAYRYNDVRNAVSAIPAYVDNYLDKLFAGEKCDVNTARDAKEWWVEGKRKTGEERCIGDNAGTALVKGTTYKFLLLLVGLHYKDADDPPSSLAKGVQLSDIGLQLAHYGAEAFRAPRNASEAARELERVLESGYIQKFKLQPLRKYLRQQLINYLVHSLDFGEVEWNRR